MASGIPKGYLSVGGVVGWSKWPVVDIRDMTFYLEKIKGLERSLETLRVRVATENAEFAATLKPIIADPRVAILHAGSVEYARNMSALIRLACRHLREPLPLPGLGLVEYSDMIPPSIREYIKEAP